MKYISERVIAGVPKKVKTHVSGFPGISIG